ncbi:MAG: ComEC/Rec2 family competence protein [Candidatus Thorarchaeota archaeon]
MTLFCIEMLPACSGDCIWIKYGNPKRPHNILIDGGFADTYNAIRQRLQILPTDQRHFELLIVTHVDRDHIGGILKLLSDPDIGVTFDDIWFNGWDHLPVSNLEALGPPQGEKLTDLLEKPDLPWNERFNGKSVSIPQTGPLTTYTLESGIKLTLLSPGLKQLSELRPYWLKECRKAGLDPTYTPPPRQAPPGFEVLGPLNINVEDLANTTFEKDTTKANGSSIAVLAEFDSRRALLTGDAHSEVLFNSIQRLVGMEKNDRLRLDAFKLPHHGSMYNISQDLLEKIDCKRYLFSTNGTGHHKHPDNEAVARVIKFGGPEPELIFNYRSIVNLIWEQPQLIEKYNYSVSYPKAGQTIDL